MSDNTAIEWTEHTWNPWQGCTPVSEGCDNCYMVRAKRRWGKDPLKVVRSSDAIFYQPTKKKWKAGDKIFTCSWSDFFHPIADPWREEAWKLIRDRPDLIFQILTKRPENIEADDRMELQRNKNVWLGVTAENQARADERIPILLGIPAAVRFVSLEPLLEPIDLRRWLHNGLCRVNERIADGSDIDAGTHLDKGDCICTGPAGRLNQVIVGAETGPGARPMNPDWARSVRDQCVAAGVPFFFKKDSNGSHLLDGREWNQFPEVS